ncbi:MAG: dephospho-CoA kinase [Clostridia bacterium]
MKMIGLTGGIGAGKTTVARRLAALGAEIISADEISRTALFPNSPCIDKIYTVFGETVFSSDGVIDRKKLSGIVFNDKDALNKLNSIMHPYIIGEMKDIAFERKKSGTSEILLFDVPLLIETGFHEFVDEVWVVDAPMELKIKRVMERDFCSREDVLCRMNAQMSDDKKNAFATNIIMNCGDMETLYAVVDELYAVAIKK